MLGVATPRLNRAHQNCIVLIRKIVKPLAVTLGFIKELEHRLVLILAASYCHPYCGYNQPLTIAYKTPQWLSFLSEATPVNCNDISQALRCSGATVQSVATAERFFSYSAPLKALLSGIDLERCNEQLVDGTSNR
jgi:hypothetical protein